MLVDPAKGTWKVLKSDIHFANGVQLHPDGKTVLVVETAKSRIWRVALDGSGASLFGPVLPGYPDNIRTSPRGGFWVSMWSTRYQGAPSLLDWLGSWPKARSTLLKVRFVLHILKPL